jgi:1-acylglycerone phosphate reductase
VRLTFETNVFGVMAMVQAFAPLLIPAKGLIVNIASLAAVTPYVFGSVYCASKGALVSYSRTLRQELRPFGVRVMTVMAGTVKSNINYQTHRQLPEGSVYRPIEDTYRWRLTYSSTHASVTCDDFARQLVAAAQRREAPVWLRTWLGRPDWLWAGGMAGLAWFGTVMGEWLLDTWFYSRFKMAAFEKMLRRQEAEKKKGN